MSTQLIQEISLKDSGYQKGVKQAKDALKELAKENGVAGAHFRNVNTEVNAAKKYFSTLTVEYNRLSESAKKSEFGQAIKKQMDSAEKDLQEMYNGLERVNAKLEELQKAAKKKVKLEIQQEKDTGSFFGNIKQSFKEMDMNKMVGGVLDKAGLGEAASAMETLGGVMGGGVAAGAAVATAGIAAAGFAIKETIDVTEQAIEKSAEFGLSMSQLGAITGVAGKDLDSMRSQVMAVGKDTNTSFSEVARNFALVGSALPELLHDADGMEEVSRAAITLHKAGLMPLEDATNSLTSTMAQFGKDSSEAGNVVDVLANAAKLGSADIGSVSDTLNKCGTAANQAGVSLEQAAAMTEVLAQKGLKGAEAGTALRNVLMNMSTKGIDEINPKVVGVQTALENLQKHAGDASWMVKVFGQEGATAASIIGNGLPQYEQMVKHLDDVGTASQMAEQNENNLATAWENTKTQWNNLLSSLNVDGGNSPLMAIVQQIQNIIGACDDLFSQIGQSTTVQAWAEAVGASFDLIGQLISSIIEVIGDCIDIILEVVDAGGQMEKGFNFLTTVYKVLKQIIWGIEALVWGIKKLISICIEAFVNFRSELGKQLTKLPFADKVIDAFKTIQKWIEKTLQALRKFKAEYQKLMDEDRQGTSGEDNKKKDNSKKKNKKKDNSNTNTDEVKEEQGLIEKLEQQIKDLKEKKEKSQSKNEIAKLNKQIDAKQKELNKLNNTGSSKSSSSSSSSSNSKSETPEEKYKNKIAQIEAKLAWQLYDLEDENNNEKKAIEDRIEAIDSYIDELTKDEKAIKKNASKVKELTKEENAYKLRLKTVTRKVEDYNIVKTANQDYKKTIDQLNQDRKNGWTTEEEYNDKYINAVKELTDKYKTVNNVNDELVSEINKKQKEIENLSLAKEFKQADLAVKDLIHDFDDIMNNKPAGNAYYNEKREANSKISQGLEKFQTISQSHDEWKQLEGKQQKAEWIKNNQVSATQLGVPNFDVDAISKIGNVASASEEEIEILDVAIEQLNKALLGVDGSQLADVLGSIAKSMDDNKWLEEVDKNLDDISQDAINYIANIVNEMNDADASILQWIKDNEELARSIVGDEVYDELAQIEDITTASKDELKTYRSAISDIFNAYDDQAGEEWGKEMSETIKSNIRLLGEYTKAVHTSQDAIVYGIQQQTASDWMDKEDISHKGLVANSQNKEDYNTLLRINYDRTPIDKLKNDISELEDNKVIELDVEVNEDNIEELRKEIESKKMSPDIKSYLLEQIDDVVKAMDKARLQFNIDDWKEFLNKLEENEVEIPAEVDLSPENIEEVKTELEKLKVNLGEETFNMMMNMLEKMDRSLENDVQHISEASDKLFKDVTIGTDNARFIDSPEVAKKWLKDVEDILADNELDIIPDLSIVPEDIEKMKAEIMNALSQVEIPDSVFDSISKKIEKVTKKALKNPKIEVGKGDASNYSINTTSYDRLEKKAHNFSKNGDGIDKMSQQMDMLLDKYKDAQDKLVQIKEKNDKLSLNIDTESFEEQMRGLESQIDKLHDRIEKQLNFEVKLDATIDGLNSLENLSNYALDLSNFKDEWDSINDDEDDSDFQKVLKHTNQIISTLVSTMQTYNTVLQLCTSLQNVFAASTTAAAAADTAAATAEVGASVARTSAAEGEAIAGATSSGAKLPFPANIAAIAAGVAAVIAAITMISSFANGGIVKAANGLQMVGGSSFAGDTTLIRANRGEMILNNLEQKNLFDVLQGKGNFLGNNGGEVEFRLRGQELVGLLTNYNNKKSRLR